MNLLRLCRAAGEIAGALATHPRLSFRRLRNLARPLRGNLYAQDWQPSAAVEGLPGELADLSGVGSTNPLRTYFEAHTEGRGIWKWDHYFDIYHRHLKRFIGREVRQFSDSGNPDLWWDHEPAG